MNDEHVAYEKLLAFAADELSGFDIKRIAIHVAICAECSATVARFKTISFLMRTDDSQEPPSATIARAKMIFARHRSIFVWRRIQSLLAIPSVRRFSMAVMIVLLILSNVMMYGSIDYLAVTSRDAIPGDSLYPTKLAMEGIQLATSWSTESKLQRHIDFAGFRVNEVGALVAMERLTEIPSTLAAFENQVAQVSITFKVLVKENYQRAKVLGAGVDVALSQYSTTLADVRGIAADAIRPALEHAISICDTNRTSVSDLYLLPPTPVPTATPTPSITPIPSAARSATPSPARILAPAASNTPRVEPAATNTPMVVPTNTTIPVVTPTPRPPSTNTPALTATPTWRPPPPWWTPFWTPYWTAIPARTPPRPRTPDIFGR